MGRGRLVGLPVLQLERQPVFLRQRDSVSLLAAWDRRHHWSEGAGFLRWVLCSPGNFTQIRWERHPLGNGSSEPRAFARRFRKFIAIPFESVVVEI